MDRLLFHCPFATACWSLLFAVIPGTSDPCVIVESLKMQLRQPFFMEIIVTMCWSIWMMRNDMIFRGIPHFILRCKEVFKKEFALVKLRAKAALHPRIDLWREASV